MARNVVRLTHASGLATSQLTGQSVTANEKNSANKIANTKTKLSYRFPVGSLQSLSYISIINHYPQSKTKTLSNISFQQQKVTVTNIKNLFLGII